MKILQYNIYDGCEPTDRYEMFSNWMKENTQYDVVGLNEVNHWTEEKLKNEAKKWGYSYSYLFESMESPYLIGVISKYPIKLINKYEDPLHHGLIHVEIEGINFLITHLIPFDSIKRERECQFIADIVKSITGPTIIMGDLNTMSPLDQEHYDKDDVTNRLLLEGKLSKELRNNKVNYRPLQILLDAGFYDIGYSETFKPTIPTRLGATFNSPIKRRIDYILVNEQMMKLKPSYSVVEDSVLEDISDHYPIECYW